MMTAQASAGDAIKLSEGQLKALRGAHAHYLVSVERCQDAEVQKTARLWLMSKSVSVDWLVRNRLVILGAVPAANGDGLSPKLTPLGVEVLAKYLFSQNSG